MTTPALEKQVERTESVRLRPCRNWTAQGFIVKFGPLTFVHVPNVHQGASGNPVRLRTAGTDGKPRALEYAFPWHERDLTEFHKLIDYSVKAAKQPAERANLAGAYNAVKAYADAKARYRG